MIWTNIEVECSKFHPENLKPTEVLVTAVGLDGEAHRAQIRGQPELVSAIVGALNQLLYPPSQEERRP